MALVVITVLVMFITTRGSAISRQTYYDSISDNEIPTDAASDPINADELKFTLFSKEGTKYDIPISIQNSSEYLKQVFKLSWPTKFIVHGWMGSLESIIVRHTGTVYLEQGDYNIVGVDWANLAAWKFYPVSTYNVALVGNGVAALVDKLVKSEAIRVDELHLIGHSLGAHVMGIAGAAVKSGRVPRITGLDPANPGFEYIAYETSRLDVTDAEFVDVIHTSGMVAGFYGALGHADFYPNGGTPPQPGCAEISCSHGRSYEYFTESITNPKGFRAVECDSWSSYTNGSCNGNMQAYMGAQASNTAKGVFYLETNAEPPFARG